MSHELKGKKASLWERREKKKKKKKKGENIQYTNKMMFDSSIWHIDRGLDKLSDDGSIIAMYKLSEMNEFIAYTGYFKIIFIIFRNFKLNSNGQLQLICWLIFFFFFKMEKLDNFFILGQRKKSLMKIFTN